MIKLKRNSFISILLVAIIMTTFVFSLLSNTPTVYADEISDLEQKIREIDKKNKQIDSQLNDLKGKLDYEEENQIILKEKIVNTTEQISLYNKKIKAMNESINQKNIEIDAKSEDIYASEELFAQRIRSMYISNSSSSTLSYVLGAKSFSEILTRAEVLKRVTESDTDLINTLTDEKDELASIKQSMEQQNEALTQTKLSLDKSSANLKSMEAQSKANEASIQVIQKKYYEEKQANKKEQAKIDAEIDRILAERANQGQAPEGAYKWPVPSSSRITSPYGWRKIYGKSEFHLGIDIGAKSGAAIVAAQPGTVVIATYSNSYGNYVVIDHGGGYGTLYAHCSRLDVKVGDTVTRGQTIAGIGTTGASYGNHLHFEVRINGERKDPKNYVVAP